MRFYSFEERSGASANVAEPVAASVIVIAGSIAAVSLTGGKASIAFESSDLLEDLSDIGYGVSGKEGAIFWNVLSVWRMGQQECIV